MLAPQAAMATCSTAPFQTYSVLPQPIKARFDALRSSDPIENRAERAAQWQTLIDELKHQTVPDFAMLALAQSVLSSELAETGQEDRALALAEAAEKTAATHGLAEAPAFAEILANLAVAQLNAGKAAPGMVTAEKALEASSRRAGTLSMEAVLANDAMARAYFGQNRFAEAEPFFREAARVAPLCFAQNSYQILSMMDSHSATLSMMGNFQAGTEGAIRAVNWGMAHLKEDNPELGTSIQNLAADFSFTRQLSEAEPMFRKAVDLQAKNSPNDWDTRANTLSNFAEVLDLQGKYDEADAAWALSRSLAQKSAHHFIPHAAVLPLSFSANAAERRGNHALALQRYDDGIAEAEKVLAPDNTFLAELRLNRALVMSALDRARLAYDNALPAIAVLRAKMPPTHPRRLVSEIHFAGIAASALGAEKAYEIAAPVAQTLEARMLGSTTSQADLISSAALFQTSFSVGTALALQTKRNDDAFHLLQLANLSNLVIANSTTAARAVIRDPVAKGAYQRLQDHIAMKQTLARQRLQTITNGDSAAVTRIDDEITRNTAAIADAAAELDRIYPAYRDLQRPTPVGLAAFQATLGPNQMLLAPLPFQNGTFAVAITRDALIWESTSATAPQIKELVRRLRASIDAAQNDPALAETFDTDAAAELFAALVPPKLRPIFATHRDLLFYTSGPLASLPPGLLLTKPGPVRKLSSAPWLIKSHSVTILPTLARRPAQSAVSPPVRFLGLGAPLPSASSAAVALRGIGERSGRVDQAALRALPALPQSVTELDTMRKLLGGTGDLILSGADMTETQLRSLPLDQFSVIAFATHGLVGGDFAGVNEPALVMTPSADNDSEDNGLLTASKVAGLHINADWVILSACNSASGNGAGMPAYGGLATTFMQAGARALLVSHWPVRDDAAERLTVGTLANSRHGMGRADALRQATIKLMHDRKIPGAAHPEVWAPFVLIER